VLENAGLVTERRVATRHLYRPDPAPILRTDGIKRLPAGAGRVGYPARAGGLWLRSTLDRSRFQAVVVPSGLRTRVQPIRWIATWWW
jgi:hypothetical protein